MKRLLTLMALLGWSLAVFAQPAAATWVSNNCNGSSSSDSNVKRSEAQSYSAVANHEGYEWGGGCWNDNNIDDTPGQPDSSGEGPDCSGFVFKTWEMVNSYGSGGWTYYSKLKNIHGPYSASSFYGSGTSNSLPFYQLSSKSSTLYMDAFASSGHIGMIYTMTDTTATTDTIIEAKSDTAGVGKWTRDYRGSSSYRAIRRKGWTADCYPNCAMPAVVVVR